MPNASQQNLEYLSWEGPLSLGPAVLLGMVLALLFAWSLYRERRILGPKLTSLFLVLRMVVLVTLFWMLLAPTSVQVQKTKIPRQVTLALDQSGSMNLVDVPGKADQARWEMAADSEFTRPLARIDAAITATAQADLELKGALAAIAAHRSEETIHQALLRVGQALEQATGQLKQLAEAGLPESIVQQIYREQSAYSAGQFGSFQELLLSIRKGRTPQEQSWRESLVDLQFQLVDRMRHLQILAETLSEQTTVSTEIPENQPQLSRSEHARSVLEQLQASVLERLREQVDFRFVTFEKQIQQQSGNLPPAQSTQQKNPTERLEDQESSTNLSGVLDELLRTSEGPGPAALFLISDVAHNQPETEPPGEVVLRSGSLPIYVVPIGNTNRVRDLAIQAVSAPQVAMRNDDIVIEVKLEGYEFAGQKCLVELLQQGQALDFREVALESDFVSRVVRFERLLPEVGKQTFQIAVRPLPDEATEENNYAEFDVNVTRSDLKILLADSLPRWEYRYLTQLFRRDAKVECDELLFHPRLIATGRRAESQALPETVEDWDQYDVVILGDLAPEQFSRAAQLSLQEYLQQRGGTLIVIAGQNAMPDRFVREPFMEWLPVTRRDSSTSLQSDYAFQLTREGQDHAALMIGESKEQTALAWEFVNQFAPLHDLSEWRVPKPSAETLISAVSRQDPSLKGNESAFLTWQPLGRGRVIYLAGPETYRLRFLRGDSLHYRFWGQLMRWAIASEMGVGTEFVRISTEKTRYSPQETVHVTVQFQSEEGTPIQDDMLSLKISSRSLERSVPLVQREGIPGEYRAEILPLPAGVYRIEPQGDAITPLIALDEADAQASFTVLADRPLEMADTRLNLGLATQLAEVSQGLVIPPTAMGTILQLLDLNPLETEKTLRVPLWQRWFYLWIIVISLTLEWSYRKWYGLS
ncbi:MAG: hypothetical protein KDA78_03935 [Planctomycetaceae bacterium]|nr:hypothetical protein [Planctomycetaceae bacterium]